MLDRFCYIERYFFVIIQNINSMSSEEIMALQKKSFEILCYFKDFCQQQGLTFFLAGGSLIGAIRHQGFIPWDDDVDVFMLRDDYERLPNLWQQYADKNKYSYCRTNLKENYHNTGASIRDNNTTFINRHSVKEDIHHGLQIDILPIDILPESKMSKWKQVFWASVYSLFNAQRLPDRQGKIIRLISWGVLNLIKKPSIRYKIWNFAQQKMISMDSKEPKFYVELTSGIRSMFRPLNREWFRKAIWKKFNNVEMPVMNGYDAYLKSVWGDYMKLPPEEDRVAKHNTVFIDLDNSYKKYRGKYYLK